MRHTQNAAAELTPISKSTDGDMAWEGRKARGATCSHTSADNYAKSSRGTHTEDSCNSWTDARKAGGTAATQRWQRTSSRCLDKSLPWRDGT